MTGEMRTGVSMGGRTGRGAVTRRAMFLAAMLLSGCAIFSPSPAAADPWVKNDLGKGYDALAQGGLYSVAIGDGDQDGGIEVYASCYDNGHVYEYRRENLQWTIKDLGVLMSGRYPRADALLVGDGDDDGRTEVYASGTVMTTTTQINSVYRLENGTGGWTTTDIGQSGGWGMDLSIGDGNRDGRVELYSADADGHIYQYSKGNAWNVQDIGGSPPFYYNNNWFSPYMRGARVGDADNDGRDEVYGAATDGHAYRFNFTGSGWERSDLGAGQNSTFPLYGLLGLAIGDADNDGQNEVYASSYYNASIWRYKFNAASGIWNLSRTFYLTGTMTANDLCIGDGNSDGKNELYVGTSNKQLYEIRLEGGTWKNASVGSGNGAINGVAVGPVTADKQVLQLYAASADGHCYEYYQDRVAPANPVVQSDTHPVPGTWYNDRRVHVLWTQPGFDFSGINGYATLWDDAGDTVPWPVVTYEESTTDIHTTLADGRWYFHLRTGDNALNWNATAVHFGPVLIDTTSPDSMEIAINGGAGLANGRLVSLSVNATDPSPGSGIAQMSFSNDGGNWSGWEAFCATRGGWDLADPAAGGNDADGTKTVFARVRDGVGREIPADRRARATIFLDRQGPAGLDLSINGGAGFTNSTEVRLEMSAGDPEPASGVARMAFSNDGINWGEWRDWSDRAEWSLAEGAVGGCADGKKTVLFRVQDRAGNVGGPAEASILLDTQSPGNLGITIDGGAQYTNASAVALDLSAGDPEPGSLPMEMALSNSENASGAWEPFSAGKPRWSLTGGPGGTDTDGEKAVRLRVRDAAGNEGGPVRATIFLDRIMPGALRIAINAGDDRTNRPDVELSLGANDTAPSSGIDGMQFCTDGSNWSSWEPFSSKRLFTLSGPDGPKTIRFRVRDRAGNVADEASASILLHISPPVISDIAVSAITNDSATVSWSTDEPSTGRVDFGSGTALDRSLASGGRAHIHTARLSGLSPNATYRFRVSSADELANNATSAETNFTTLESYTPPPPGQRPRPAPERGFPWVWAAVPALAVGAAAGLFLIGRSRRNKAPGRSIAEAGAEPSAGGPPEALQAAAGATGWEEELETLSMDDGIPTAVAEAVGPGPLPGAARPALPARRAPGPPGPKGHRLPEAIAEIEWN
jgi:hypothetical protein